MSFTMFIMLFTLGALVASLLTEALKKALDEAGKTYSSNFIALIMALVVGGGGTTAAYVLLDVAFNTKSIICIVLMAVAIWVGAMVGYDKVCQLLEQIHPKE